MSYRENIKATRQAKKMSLRELEDKSMVGFAELSRVENGLKDLSVPQLICVAKALGCKAADLLGE